MLQINTEKYNLAWFKLADFVARKEKEKALGIYRLLKLSIEDKAFALQLEGDILLSFHDAKAVASYHKAGQLYEMEHRFIEAIGVYSHLLNYIEDKIEVLEKLIFLWNLEKNNSKSFYNLKLLIENLILQNRLKSNSILYTKFQSIFSNLELDEAVFIAKLNIYNLSPELKNEIEQFLNKTIKQGFVPSQLLFCLDTIDQNFASAIRNNLNVI